MTIDPVTLAILKGRFEQIADEMDATLFRSAFNPIIAEAHDASHGFYDAETGETWCRANPVCRSSSASWPSRSRR
jgi:N-methylhydantoinase B